jgi:hypothetical protein
MKSSAILLLAGLACVLLPALTGRPDPLPGLPKLMLWAWESPQDLRFVQPGRAGIAFLARTVWLDSQHARSRPRLQPLRYNPGTDLMAVVRFESAGQGLPVAADAVSEVQPVVRIAGVRALQIDFDARQSERDWYAGFLGEMRRTMPQEMPLTITALESWCEHESWIDALPVVDATPMLFRMGRTERVPNAFGPRLCRSSIGVSTDELHVRVPRARRTFFFHTGAWTPDAYGVAVAQLARWAR